MTVMINILIFIAIFGYAFYTLVKFFKRSKQGKCGTCEIDRDCCSTEQRAVKHFPGK
ncbi:FeoB-associated Cys-rich membrane protein [Staphylococcus argenteus]|uniref:FeoB-associated Cys-rich membrane protein n=1 Tax=Staphylococcus argenteus TaxID=985002 RepID=UPI0005077C2B|nr:FeoB-associated Cys-rich membrane protein [Staphylococcus argenteus]MCG9854759.1 FeoB-associated Cys-rich membrane protein [Staphylococcus argenteus]MDR7649564.1 FeoB-associated Cys-rich membrane protein [Staphylococcus argenteus]MDR7682712.1 FeoB-associated Cys-rich membrane protein [Staphylococcus argenteus]CDR25530.1 virus attachment p12 family protein [Staphylococcus argenteus]SGW88114.1 virus attachment p12 family protein [Staphylococcus argenteus]